MVAAAVLRPSASSQTPRRGSRGFARAAAMIAAAPLVATALFSSASRLFALSGPPAPLAASAAAETMVFVTLPDGCLGISRGPATSSRVTRAAGPDAPGSAPVLEGEAPPIDEGEAPRRLRPGEETNEMQSDRVAKRSKWLKSLKGKFVPKGPKPWDKHQFLKVCIVSRLKSKQAANTKILNQVVEEVRRISGKHPEIANSKINNNELGWRKGYPCGVHVILKGRLMHDFLRRLNTLILPRVRDFEGLYPTSVDNWGNFWMGFENQEPFKELDELVDSRELVHGFDVGLINNCMTHEDGVKLMKEFGFPFGAPRPRKEVKVDESTPWAAAKAAAARKAKGGKKR